MFKSLTAIAVALLVTTGAANAGVINGSYLVTSNNGATITNLLANPFSLNLTLNIGQTFDLVNIFENSGGTSTITAAFSFTAPSVLNDSDTATDTFSITGNARHDSLTWANSGLLTENFADGSVLEILLGNDIFNGVVDHYTGLIAPVTFTLTKAPSVTPTDIEVPEPLTLSLYGAGLAGITILRRRKQTKA
jgi:hypothetical protein